MNALPSPFDKRKPKLSQDLLLGSCVDGQVYLWDRRVDDSNGAVRRFEMPKGTPPWAATVRLPFYFLGQRTDVGDRLYGRSMVRRCS